MEESFICESLFEVQTCNAIRLATEAEKLFELMRMLELRMEQYIVSFCQ